MLKPEQYTAIEWLVQPKHGGKTLEEIAELCGVSRQTLHTWRRSEAFQDELKAEVRRLTSDRLGEVMAAMIDGAVKDRNAAAAKLLLQANGMLTDNVAINVQPAEKTTDVDALRARLEALKVRQSEA